MVWVPTAPVSRFNLLVLTNGNFIGLHVQQHLANLNPSDLDRGNGGFHHSVQFYEQDSFLIQELGRHFAPLMAAGTPVIVIASREHREALKAELAARGVEVSKASLKGLYVALDAQETLAQFMVEGWPDEARFSRLIGGALVALQAKAGGKRVAAFGEMVALLWAEGKHDAAIRLEQLWNDADKSRLCSLVCAYPLSGFDREKHARMFFSICGEHTDVVPVEGYALAQGQKRRAMARMQQRNQALEREIELSRERISLLQSSTEAGTWEMDLLDDTVTFSSKAAGILGLHATQMSVQQFTGLIAYSGDRDGFNEAIRRSRVGRKQFVTEFRVRRKNNEVRVLSLRGRAVYNAGRPLVLGVLADVTPKAEQGGRVISFPRKTLNYA